MTDQPDVAGLPPDLNAVLESAAKLQRAVPEAVLVGGSAAALYARHRVSFDHDHVLTDLAERYELVLDACEATDGWATNYPASRPPLTLLGTLDGIEAGLRQLRRSRPLEIAEVRLDGGATVRVPTLAETLRVKGFLVVQRNVVRDYLDVVGLAARCGEDEAAAVLVAIDAFYRDRSGVAGSVATALAERLAEPSPRDTRVIAQLPRYKGLDPRWHSWPAVQEACGVLAARMVEKAGSC